MLCTSVALCLLTSSAMLAAQPAVRDGVLTNEVGMSLYVWDNDVAGSGKSLCEGICSLSWPPFLAKDDAKPSGEYALIVRDDGKKQWTYKGKPLYLWFDDKKPGDREGDGFRGVRHLARP
jgi:predicted lipoprotein with Yx(FWY)xxD motif